MTSKDCYQGRSDRPAAVMVLPQLRLSQSQSIAAPLVAPARSGSRTSCSRKGGGTARGLDFWKPGKLARSPLPASRLCDDKGESTQALLAASVAASRFPGFQVFSFPTGREAFGRRHRSWPGLTAPFENSGPVSLSPQRSQRLPSGLRQTREAGGIAPHMFAPAPVYGDQRTQG